MAGRAEAFALGRGAIESGYRLEVHEEVGSTNDRALALAERGEPSRLWVVAHRQTGGRGRHGRAWASPPGNLYASLLLIDPCDAIMAPELGFVTGVALFEAASTLTALRHPRLSLKWPNDLLIDGAKCAGILLEGRRLASGALAVVIGVGSNVTEAPEGAARLAAFAASATAASLLQLLSDNFATCFASFSRAPFGEAHFQDWALRAHAVGSQVRVKMPRGDVVGRFQGLDRGRLVVETAEGRKTLDAGDLYVLDAGGASPLRALESR